MATPPQTTAARLQVLAAAALFSTGGVAIKACSLTSWQVAGSRSAIAALVLWIVLPAPADRRPAWSWGTVVVSVAYAATMVLFVAGNKLTTAANTIFLQSTAPLYMLLIGPWLLAEPIRRKDLYFMTVLGTGLLLFFVGGDPISPTAPDPQAGNLLAALSGCTWAMTVGGLRWIGKSESDSTRTTLVMGNGIALLVCLPWALPVSSTRPEDWLAIAYLGTVQVGAAYILLGRGIRRVPAFEASLLLLLEPVLATVWAATIYAEQPGPWSLGGCVVILSATLVKTWVDRSPPIP